MSGKCDRALRREVLSSLHCVAEFQLIFQRFFKYSFWDDSIRSLECTLIGWWRAAISATAPDDGLSKVMSADDEQWLSPIESSTNNWQGRKFSASEIDLNFINSLRSVFFQVDSCEESSSWKQSNATCTKLKNAPHYSINTKDLYLDFFCTIHILSVDRICSSIKFLCEPTK